MINLDVTLRLENLVWQSDWNGYEVGYPEVPVVGLYSNTDEFGNITDYYIDTESNRLLEWSSAEPF